MARLSIAFLLLSIFCFTVQGRSVDVKAQNPGVHFLLWTRRNPSASQELRLNDPTGLGRSNYNSALPTKIFAHGFTMTGTDGSILDMRDAMLRNQDCNFISVDWGVLAVGPNYFAAANNVFVAGLDLGNFVNYLVAQGGSISRFHLIGFSLGAHVVGYAGKVARNIPRITGLDPAYPAFSVEDTDTRLDTSDAVFVDVIHTNSGNLLEGALSFPQPIGHVDFFPNGGNSQPGCGVVDLQKADIIDLINGCSHGRAPIYFTESINGGNFRSTKCSSYANFAGGNCAGGAQSNMGFGVSTTARGEFYLDTNSQAPFSKN